MCYEKVHCGYTPPSRDGLSYANKKRNADTAEKLFLKGLGVFSGGLLAVWLSVTHKTWQ
mgnify:FL=1